MNVRLARRSVTTTIASAVVAVSASCLTLGSIVLLFGTVADHSTVSVAAPQPRAART